MSAGWKALFAAGLTLVVTAAIGAFVAIWWWALAGMSENVGAACMFSVVAGILAGGFMATIAYDMGHES